MTNSAAVAPRRFRLIPEDRYIGWTPYLWLVYFPFFFVGPLEAHASASYWAATIVAGIVFLALYFRAYWTRGRELVAITIAIALLGFLFHKQNPGASVFLIYAASFAGVMQPRRRALMVLGTLCASIVAVGLAGGTQPGFWMVELFFAAVIGTTNIHFTRVRSTTKALERAREEIEQLARVAERERIARDLHDVLGHTLTLITLKSALAARIAEREPSRAAREMREVERVSREALQDVRSAVAGQRDVGLARELANAKVMLGAAGIAVEHAASSVPLSSTEETVLALAMREAVTNIVRHAGASTCRITLTTDGTDRRLAVEDNGRGKRGPDGNGLTGMRERVRALGGRLDVDSGTLSGTRVQITFGGAPL